MSSTGPCAISNAGPLIHLSRAGLLHLLGRLFDRVLVPREVVDEVVDRGKERGSADALQVEGAIAEGWIRVAELNVPAEFLELSETAGLERAETAVIFLAKRSGCLALLDDEAARVFSRALGVEMRGSIGVIIQALKAKLVTPLEALDGLERLSEVMYLNVDTYRLARREIEKISRERR